jgi:hypothetical protein
MKNAMLLTLILGTTLMAQEDEGKRRVEGPIRRNVGPAPEKFDLAATGIDWKQGMESALNKGKPILLFQLLGNFDHVYC